MSLNDEALADLQQTNTQLTTHVSGHMQEDKLPPENANDLAKMVGTTATAKVQFQDVSTSTTKVLDLQDVADEIAGAGGVSRADADTVNTAFEGFYGNVSAHEFTRIPTATNYRFTLEFMSRSIKVVQEGVRSKFEAFLSGPLKDVQATVAHIQAEHIETLQEVYGAIAAKATQLAQQIENNKNLVVPFPQGTFTDLRTVGLQLIDPEHLRVPDMDTRALEASVKNFQDLWKEYGLFRSLMLGVLENKSSDEITSSASMISSIPRITTIADLLKIASSPYLLEVLHTFITQTEKSAQAVELLAQEAQSILTNPVEVQKFLAIHTETIGRMLADAHTLVEAVANLLQIANSLDIIITDFARF